MSVFKVRNNDISNHTTHVNNAASSGPLFIGLPKCIVISNICSRISQVAHQYYIYWLNPISSISDNSRFHLILNMFHQFLIEPSQCLASFFYATPPPYNGICRDLPNLLYTRCTRFLSETKNRIPF